MDSETVEEVQEQVEMEPVVDMEAVERERARVEANRAAAMTRLEKERAKMVLMQQLPRSVAVVKIPASLEGWKDARAVARATTAYVGKDCRGTYDQVHALRPAGRDWIGMIQAVRMRANMMQGSCDGRGPAHSTGTP